MHCVLLCMGNNEDYQLLPRKKIVSFRKGLLIGGVWAVCPVLCQVQGEII